MTCIVGLERPEGVYIGGDSAAISSSVASITRVPKVFRIQDLVFGCAGGFRAAQLIQHSFVPPEKLADISDMAYMVTAVVSKLRDLLSTEPETLTTDLQALIGYNGTLYQFWTQDWQINSSDYGYYALGSAWEVALGAMYCLVNQDINPEDILIEALDAATQHCIHVRPPYSICFIQKEKP